MEGGALLRGVPRRERQVEMEPDGAGLEGKRRVLESQNLDHMGDRPFFPFWAPRGALVNVYIWIGGRLEVASRRVQIQVGITLGALPSVCISWWTWTHTQAGSRTRGAHAWHSQPPPVPHAHADTRSHPGRHHAQALPGPDTRPARTRLEIPIRLGSTNTVWRLRPQSPWQGGGARWPMG